MEMLGEKGLSKNHLITPAVLVDLDLLERNISETSRNVKACGKEIWPMIKTHKSLEIARMQAAAGASGFLCGTLSEAEMMVNDKNVQALMLAYPVSDKENLERCVALAKTKEIIFRIDGKENGARIDKVFGEANVTAKFVLKIDVGVHRFGVEPADALNLAVELGKYRNLKFLGISTHPGHCYAAKNEEELEKISGQALKDFRIAYDALKGAGFELKIVSIGSTPSFKYDIREEFITHVHPGNYVYYDAMQVALGVVPRNRCALTVLASVISWNNKRSNVGINAGSKTFTRDLGGHEIRVVNGYGIVKGHDGAELILLSEEVGLIHCEKNENIHVGDKLEIIPNHACSVNNQTSYLIGIRKEIVEKVLKVTARNGS